MPLINLIREEQIAARKAAAKARIATSTLAGAVVLSALAFGALFIMKDKADNDVRSLKEQIAKQKPITAQVEANRASLGDLTPRLSTLEDAHVTTTRWIAILDHLTRQTPGEMWLTNLRSSQQDASKPVLTTFTGVSRRLELIGEFMLRLQGCKELQAIQLKDSREKLMGERRGIEFEIGSEVAGTEEKKKEVDSEEEKKST